jgi:SAM-dependent methyltransferase
MSALRRAARVVADEGLGGLLRKIARKTLRPGTPPEAVPAQVPTADALAEARRIEEQRLALVRGEVEQLLTATRRAEEQRLVACWEAEQRRQAEERLEAARQMADAHAAYAQEVAAFAQRTRELGCTGLEEFYWYHTVDLGNGLVTPGDHDFRGQVASFHFPENMAGMRALDVGSATGFFAFEFERRGAEVTSVELPSLEDWDILSCDREGLRQRLLKFFKTDTQEEAYRRHLDGPFLFCHKMLKSRVRRCYSTVYDLGKTPLAGSKFDFIYAGDILLHLFSPLKALDVLSELCGGSLMVTIDVPFPGGHTPLPLAAYMGGHNLHTDSRTWWTLSSTLVEHALKRMGFETVSVVGNYAGVIRRNWIPYRREVILATRGKN